MINHPTKFKSGQRIQIVGRGGGWDGVTGTIVNVRYVSGDYEYRVQYDDPEATPFGTTAEADKRSWWTQEGGYLALEPSDAPRPVDGEGPKASLTHDTSKDYAQHATSRLLPPWANDVLNAAAAGEEVDVVKFRKAATQALSLAATRAARSTGRRVYTREARHLIYWADAILDNHIAGLPVYEGGPRSPRIHALEQELSLLRQAASDERRRLVGEIEDLKATVHEASEQIARAGAEIDRARRSEKNEVDRTAALIREKTDLEIQVEDLLRGRKNDIAAMQDLYLEVNSANAALEYAFGLLTQRQRNRVAGFRDGYAQRAIDVPTPEH